MRTKVVVIGGGIVGLAVAERAARFGHDVTVLEKEDTWAAHQTGRNSGVVHAAPYYKPGSLKARMCVDGNRSMLEFAATHGIRHAQPGKLIVAVDESELGRLDELHQRALANGVNVRRIDEAEAVVLEPAVRAVAALRVESTGIIDYPAVSRTLAKLAADEGATLLLGARVTSIQNRADSVVVQHSRGEVVADLLINCAGLYSDKIAQMAGVAPSARIVPFRGEYFELVESKRHLVRGLIYPVPDPSLPFLGVHLTKMVDGSVHAGPNAVVALAREGYTKTTIRPSEAIPDLLYPGFLRLASRNVGVGLAEMVRSVSRRRFADSLARLVPGITAGDIIPTHAGVRAQAIMRDGTLAQDFVIQRAPRHIHVLNAPSPAATASLEIAKHLCEQAGLSSLKE